MSFASRGHHKKDFKYGKKKKPKPTKYVTIWMMWTVVHASMQYGKNESISSA